LLEELDLELDLWDVVKNRKKERVALTHARWGRRGLGLKNGKWSTRKKIQSGFCCDNMSPSERGVWLIQDIIKNNISVGTLKEKKNSQQRCGG